jgi:crotonobetainyl-CoA:carnitine CoA-transferase CaiB-like acyl-CoA transferase
MMNCGYDPNPANEYDLPPIAPQIWHAYHIAGEQLLIGILAALIERQSSGLGQDVSCAVHEAVAKNTELDLMSWVMRRAPLYRLTCRHASETVTRVPSISHTKDGRWFMTWGVGSRDRANLAPFLDRYGMAADLRAPEGTGDAGARNIPGTAAADAGSPPSRMSARGRPFALQNVRILDFSWFLASAGGTRFAAALGAESIKVEWKENPDTRLAAMAPFGGGARIGQRAASGRHRFGYGRPVQQQKLRQARHFAQHSAPEGPGDREASRRHFRHCRGGLLARRA